MHTELPSSHHRIRLRPFPVFVLPNHITSPPLSRLVLFLDASRLAARGRPWKELISRIVISYLFTVVMGNEQSAPVSRRLPNKLSKPKTNNTSTSTLLNVNSKPSNPATRQNSVSTNSSPTKVRYSFTPIEGFAGEAADRWKDEPVQRKRMSLFRSKSSQAKPKLHLRTGFDPNSPEPSPISPLDQPLPRWSSLRDRGNPVSSEMSREDHYESPVEM